KPVVAFPDHAQSHWMPAPASGKADRDHDREPGDRPLTWSHMLDGGSAEGVLMNIFGGRAHVAVGCAALLAWGGSASAQDANQLPTTVVTADRSPEPIQNTASAISVVNQQTLNISNPGSLVDALRSVPGLDISETGGPGRSSSVRLRGAN